jgi:hypothetical protein
VLDILYIYINNNHLNFVVVCTELRLCGTYSEFGSHGRCTCETKSRISMAKAAFNNKRALFTGRMDWERREKLVKCYIWSVALYGAEIGTVWGVDRKQLDSVALYGAEIGTVWGVDRKQLDSVASYGAEIRTVWGVDRKQLDSVALYGADIGTVWGSGTETAGPCSFIWC